MNKRMEQAQHVWQASAGLQIATHLVQRMAQATLRRDEEMGVIVKFQRTTRLSSGGSQRS